MNKLLTLVLAASAAASFSVSAPAYAAGGFIDTALFPGMSGGQVFPSDAGAGISISATRLNADGSTSIVYSKGGKVYAEITGFYVEGDAPLVSSADPSFTGKDGGSESVMKSGSPSHELSVMFKKSGFCHDLGDSTAELTLVQKDGDALTCSVGGEDYVMAFRDVRDSKKNELGATAILLKLEPEANGDEFYSSIDQVSNVSSVWFTKTFTKEFAGLDKGAKEQLTRQAALDAAGGLYLLGMADDSGILNKLRNGSIWDRAKRDGKVVRKAFLSLVPDKTEAGQDKFSVDASALAYTIEGDVGGETLNNDSEIADRISKDPICRGTVTERSFQPHYGKIVSCSVPLSGADAYHYYIITLDQEARRFAVVRSTADMNPNEVRGIIRDLTPRPVQKPLPQQGAGNTGAADDDSGLGGIIGLAVLILILIGLVPGAVFVLNMMRAKKGLDKVSVSDLKRLAGGGKGHTKLTVNDLMSKNVGDTVKDPAGSGEAVLEETPAAGAPAVPDATAAEGKAPAVPDATAAEGKAPAVPDATAAEGKAPAVPAPKKASQSEVKGSGESDIKKAAAEAKNAPADSGAKAAAAAGVSAEAEDKIKKAAADAKAVPAEAKPQEQKKDTSALKYSEDEDYKKKLIAKNEEEARKAEEKRKAGEAGQGGKKNDPYTLKFNAGSNYKDKLIAEEEKAAKEAAEKKKQDAAEAGTPDKKNDAYTLKFNAGSNYKDKLIAEEEKAAKVAAAKKAESAPAGDGAEKKNDAYTLKFTPGAGQKAKVAGEAPAAPHAAPNIPGIKMPGQGAAGKPAAAPKPSGKMSWDSVAPQAPKSAPNIPGIKMPGQAAGSKPAPAAAPKSAPNIPGIHMTGTAGKSAPAAAPKSAPNIPGIKMPGQGAGSKPAPAGAPKSAPNIPGIHMPGTAGKSAPAAAPKSAPNIPGIHMPGTAGKSAPAAAPAAKAPAANPQPAKVSSAMSWDSVPAVKKPAAAPAPKKAEGISGADSFVDIMKSVCSVFSWNENGDISLPEAVADSADRIVDTCRGSSSEETITSICRFIRVMLADFAEDDAPLVQKLVKAAGVPESFVSAVSEADVVKATALGGPVRMFVSLCDTSADDETRTRQKSELLGSFILIALSHFASDPKITSRDPLTDAEKERAASESDTVRMLAYLGSSRAAAALKAAGVSL